VNGLGPHCSEKEFANEMKRIYKDVTNTAVEFHARGDLFQGANIYGFLRVANAMLSHGAV
jgi:glutamate dehydrogenase (NADP+)